MRYLDSLIKDLTTLKKPTTSFKLADPDKPTTKSKTTTTVIIIPESTP